MKCEEKLSYADSDHRIEEGTRQMKVPGEREAYTIQTTSPEEFYCVVMLSQFKNAMERPGPLVYGSKKREEA